MTDKTSKNSEKKKSRKLASPIVTIALFVAAAAMLLGSTIGGTRAALQFYSANYLSSVSLKYIGVSLMETNEAPDASKPDNGYTRVAWRNYDANGVWDRTDKNLVEEGVGTLLTNLLGTGENKDKAFKIGKTYPEVLAVANTGTIDTYVRVIVTKYWMWEEEQEQPKKDDEGNDIVDENGKVVMEKVKVKVKTTQLDPGMIDLHWINIDGDDVEDADCWLIDEEASTAERTVLYYKHILDAMEQAEGQQEQKISMTEPFCDTLTVNSAVNLRVTQETKTTEKDGKKYTTITTTYDYDGTEFVVQAEVDAVQTHSAEAAIWSAWGRRVSVDASKDLNLTVDRTNDATPEPTTPPETTPEPTEQPEGTPVPDATQQPEETSVPEATSTPEGTP